MQEQTDNSAGTAVVPVSVTRPVSSQPRLHLTYLDGLRGLAALYVVMYHAWGTMIWSRDSENLAILNSPWMLWVQFGHYAVVIFIVLSGYCLMLPVMRREGQKNENFGAFIYRRARRILPPYYAALFLYLFVIACVPGLNRVQHTPWDSALPAFTPSAILPHLFLIHNLRPDWVTRIDYPMWSVATEWQIYFLFPLLLLPIWKRWGKIAVIGAGLSLGILLYYLMHKQANVCPWFLGLFAMGMAAAAVNFREPAAKHEGREGRLWGQGALLFLLSTVAISAFMPQLAKYGILRDILMGAFTGCLLIWATASLQRGTDAKSAPLLLRLLQSPCAVGLGAFSYSLYLTHAIVLAGLHLACREKHLAPLTTFAVLLVCGTALSAAIARIFSAVFEQPFIRKPSAAKRERTRQGTETPALEMS